ncbi:aminotransferase class IV [Nocardioides zeae]|uniref:Aminotransferase class IV n=1 Tax=Nocardioides imazamoxiresistens TaxID=3231893 RepID=A0ABU3PUN5_9ACTN|nr:aminotransferase class IV [Nocardioides zeae]MDT9592557.1 aminotransferase class IV [Nocardioides zeae]
MKTWVNGRLLTDPGAAVLTATDHGVTVGDGVFESIKVVDGRPFALTRHLDRLMTSGAGIGLTGIDIDAVRAGIDATLAAEHLPLGRLRLTVTGGPGPLGSGRGDGAYSVLVSAVPMSPLPAATDVVSVPWTRNEHSAVAGLKTTSYAENVVALAYAVERGASEAVFANTAGHLCEGTGSNVFYAVDGELRTPTLASGCLAGVTRALVLEWVGAREVDEPLAVAERADEVFLVSTTRDVQSVRRWGERDLGEPGPLTQRAAAVWKEREAGDIDP